VSEVLVRIDRVATITVILRTKSVKQGDIHVAWEMSFQASSLPSLLLEMPKSVAMFRTYCMFTLDSSGHMTFYRIWARSLGTSLTE